MPLRLLLFAIPLLAAAQQGAIEGTAFITLTKAPVPGVRIRVSSVSERGKFYEAVTGIDGRYRIPNLPPGDYTPMVVPPASLADPSPVDLAVKPIRVADGVSTFDAPITPPVVIRGRVLDAKREPAARARVSALPLEGGLVRVETADAEGRFSIVVAPGKYRLRAQPPPDGWAPTYFPDSTSLSSAEIVTVSPGTGIDNLDIRLRPAATAKLSGIVRDEQGRPASNVDLSLLLSESISLSTPHVRSDAAGAFELRGVPPGDWLILAAAIRDGRPWLGTPMITMPDRDLAGVDVRIYPPFPLDVELQGLPEQRTGPLAFDLRSAAGFVLPYANESDGEARFERVYNGAYRIGVRGAVPGRYLKSILLGSADVTGQQVDLGPGSPPLRFVYAPNPARISGEVENGAGAKVVLLWADRANYIPGADSVTVTCNDAGRFTSPELRPGSWYVIALPASTRVQSADTWRDRLFVQGLWRHASTVTVGEGETATVKPKLVPLD